MHGIHFELDEQGIGTLKIDRPAVRNALDWAAMDAFAEIVDGLRALTGLRALILTGGGNTFVSGGDLSDLQYYPRAEHGAKLSRIMGDALLALENLHVPTIAAINGPARGGGAEIAIACDLRVIAENADIGFVHTRLGIVTAWGGGQRLLRTLGYARALELLATGRILDARESVALGLSNLVAAAGEAWSAAREMALKMAAVPLGAISATKRFLQFGLTHDYEESLQTERAEFPALWDTEFRREAVARFLSKSKVRNNGQPTHS